MDTGTPDIIQVGTVYYAELPGNLYIRVDWNGNADFVEEIPEGKKLLPYPEGCTSEPPRPVSEKIKLAAKVAKRVHEDALRTEHATVVTAIAVLNPPKNESFFGRVGGRVKSLFAKSA